MKRADQELFRRLAINDTSVTIDAVTGGTPPSGLDPKTYALTLIAGLIASDSSVASYQWAIDVAIADGASARPVERMTGEYAIIHAVGMTTLTRSISDSHRCASGRAVACSARR